MIVLRDNLPHGDNEYEHYKNYINNNKPKIIIFIIIFIHLLLIIYQIFLYKLYHLIYILVITKNIYYIKLL